MMAAPGKPRDGRCRNLVYLPRVSLLERLVSMSEKQYSFREEVANAVTHGTGALLSVAGLTVLTLLAAWTGDAWKIWSAVVFGVSMILLYLCSTLYHAIPVGSVKKFFRKLDHSAIYLLIAGTYTPFLLVSLRGAWGWSIFGTIWGLAIAGIVFKGFLVHRFAVASTLVYLLMGWLIVIALRPLLQVLPRAAVGWLVAGGLCYTIGVVAYALKNVRHHHAVWHLFVLAGSACHYFAIMIHVIPKAR